MNSTFRGGICVVLIALSLSCGRPQSPRVVEAAKVESATTLPTAQPSVYLIGNDRGMLRPCGCSKPVTGGVDRRIAFFDAVPAEVKAQSLILSFGNLVIAGGRQQELKLEASFQAMTHLDVKAYCVGDADLSVGSSWWRDTASQIATFPLVASNLIYGGERMFKSHAVAVVDGRRFVVTGYVSPKSSAINEPGLVAAADPDIGEILAALKGGGAEKSATLVCFGTGHRDETEAFLARSGLAEAARDLLVVLTGVSDLPLYDAKSGKYPSVEMGLKGRTIAQLPLPGLDRLERHVLDETLPKSKAGGDILQLYRDAVAFEGLLEKTLSTDAATDRYAGDESCQACHRTAHASWAKSGHARAWKTLTDAGDHQDPECVRCHVVGFAQVGGFDPKVPAPVNVQCEACHGPSAKHAEELTKTPSSKPPASMCLRCHDLENSPGFKYELYWPRIAHGLDPK